MQCHICKQGLGETLKFKVKWSQAFEQLAKAPNQEFQEVQM